jgi:hypothetical protein
MKRPICIGCGCDEQHACPMDHVGFYAGCWWLRFDAAARAGVCSCCEDLVEAWERSERAPQLGTIADRFYRQAMFLYEDKASALAWIASPQQLLGGRSPRELILAGELERVQAVLDQIRDGAYI